MCLIAIAIDQNPEYPFILIANRDEFYERPTEGAHFWKDQPNLLAGRDLKAYGTWLGVSVEGKIAALTNFREPSEPDKEQSRGELPVRFLTQNVEAYDYLVNLQSLKANYNGFNLIAGRFDELYYYSNRENEVRKIQEGIHAVSNHLLNTSWPKVNLLKENLSTYLSQNEDPVPEELLKLLDHEVVALDRDLPDTGISLEWERMLSSIYIQSNTYGTRAQTIIMVSNTGEVTFVEKAGKNINKFQFFIDPS
ncbi:NRDE family protein [Alkalihalobacillus sp. R86527]|uniref:NRDE family protein n=1 Tax=Alkalihalobacillus sp. R86527 TaxID=3093863 RepID=UPI0036733C41